MKGVARTGHFGYYYGTHLNLWHASISPNEMVHTIRIIPSTLEYERFMYHRLYTQIILHVWYALRESVDSHLTRVDELVSLRSSF